MLLRGTILKSTYQVRYTQNVYISLFVPTTFGPTYYGPPSYRMSAPSRPHGGGATVKEVILKRMWEAGIKLKEQAWETEERTRSVGSDWQE